MNQAILIAALVNTAISIGFGVLAALLRKPMVTEGPRLDDLTVSDSTYGKPIPKVYGTVLIAGNIIYARDLTETREEEDVGGKGGMFGGGATSITYSYSCSFAVAYCEGEVIKILKRWGDTKLIWDSTSGNTGATSRGDKFNTYYGSETQSPDSIMEDILGDGTVPAHRGLCYDSYDEMELEDFGNRIPNMRAEVSTGSTPPTDVSLDEIAYTEIGANITSIDDIRVVKNLGFYIGRSDDGLIRVQTSNDVQTANGYVAPTFFGYSNSYIEAWDVDEAGAIYVIDYITAVPSGSIRISKVDSSSMTVKTYISVTAVESVWPTKICTVGDYILVGFEAVDKGDGHTYALIRVYNKSLSSIGDCWFQDLTIVGFPWATSMASASGIGIGLLPMTGTIIYVSLSGPTLGTISPATELYTATYDLSGDVPATATAITAAGSGVAVVCDDDKIYPYTISYNDFGWGVPAVGTPIVCGRHLRTRFPNAGKVWVQEPAADYIHYEVSIESWTILQTIDSVVVTELTDSYDPITGSVYATPGADIHKYLFGRTGQETVTLSSIIEDICNDAGLVSGEIDVTDLDDNVRGFVINDVSPARTAVEILKEAFFFDVVESDEKVFFVKRSPATPKTVTVIPESDLGAYEGGGSPPPKLEMTKQDEIEFPKEVNVQYLNPDADYETGNQRARRLIMNGQSVETYSFSGLVMSDDDAKQTAEKLMNSRWLERTLYEFQLPRKYIYLNPTDVVQITLDSVTHIIRLLKVEYGGNGLIKASGVAEDFTKYSSSATGTPGDQDHTEGIRIVGPSIVHYLDIPILRDQDDNVGFYIAACGVTSDWRGCIIYKSADDGLSYTKLCAIVSEASIGYATTELADGTVTNWDTTNTITVKMTNGTPASTTALNVLNGANAALLGNEIIQWQTSTLNGNGTYTLSNLLRGRKGTDWATDAHTIGERFIVLSTATLIRLTISSDEIGSERKYKAASVGGSFQNAVVEDFTCNAVGLECYAPVHIEGTRDISNNLTITWVRRTRVGGGWRDFVDASLGEASEEYEVDIYDGATVVRTISGITSETTSYTAAQQSTDGLTPGDPVDLIVYQLSETVGRGYGRSATV